MKRFCPLFLLVIILCSCASHKTTVSESYISADTVTVYKTDTLIINSEKAVTRDSIVHDSVIITLSPLGDTLRQVIYRDRFVYRNNDNSASVYASSTDSVKSATNISQKNSEVKREDTKRWWCIVACILLSLVLILCVYRAIKLIFFN